MKTKQRGFTLIELLITVAIVGILAKLVMPSYLSSIQQSKRKEAQAALVSFANAMEMWKMQNSNNYCASTTGACTAPTVFSAVVPVSGAARPFIICLFRPLQPRLTPSVQHLWTPQILAAR